MVQRCHYMPFGAQVGPDGVAFRLWAPDAADVRLVIERDGQRTSHAMDRDAQGWCEALLVGDAAPGDRYGFEIDGGMVVPDPASRFQPDDVHGLSEVIDPNAYRWGDVAWRGRPWEEAVVYELHVGAFTREGTFRAARERLDYLAGLGVTAVELMPVSDFPGRWNWGYDGVLPFAPDSVYGRPEDLKAFVDAAHARGLMVMLDVVYNHFGPEGNYLHVYAKRFFDQDRHTPWGAAISFDAPHSRPVRDYFIHNALFWLNEYHLDGLRFDAIHAIEDRSEPHIVAEIAEQAREAHPGRHVHLVLEDDHNRARFLERGTDGRPRFHTAQWNDDIHHALHTLLCGEDEGYYADYAGAPDGRLTRCLAEGFAYQGEPSPYRGGARRGEPSSHLTASAFVAFLQNHDQIGNRAFGERIGALASDAAVAAAHALVLLAPQVPLLFMGEEWGAKSPFLFFCDFEEGLHDPVRDGRRREFERFEAFASPEARARIPDPLAESTFTASLLNWADAALSPSKERLVLVRRLLALRGRALAPRLSGMPGHAAEILWSRGPAMHLRWTLGDGSHLWLLANMAAKEAPAPPEGPFGITLYATHPPGPGTAAPLPPWSVRWSMDEEPDIPE